MLVLVLLLLVWVVVVAVVVVGTDKSSSPQLMLDRNNWECFRRTHRVPEVVWEMRVGSICPMIIKSPVQAGWLL